MTLFIIDSITGTTQKNLKQQEQKQEQEQKRKILYCFNFLELFIKLF